MSILQVGDDTDPWIQFVGGPFDGHRQHHRSTTEPLAADVVWLVTPDSLRQIDHLESIHPALGNPLTSVALYILNTTSEHPNYMYAGSLGPRAFSDVIANLN
ncbi:hypothetical protein [Rhodopirellula sp. P2]|uniref:hypothetical protein n=1 Tax=Rhodopirellula sp. P2 TaxID=2127060 RepID=UPI0023682E14|nr:hypothetical protein [Rhodopirellula sp. P2]WDQ16769.1 hypothetical protein PSR62_24600 [Rhodopirellula sp. P2]